MWRGMVITVSQCLCLGLLRVSCTYSSCINPDRAPQWANLVLNFLSLDIFPKDSQWVDSYVKGSAILILGNWGLILTVLLSGWIWRKKIRWQRQRWKNIRYIHCTSWRIELCLCEMLVGQDTRLDISKCVFIFGPLFWQALYHWATSLALLNIHFQSLFVRLFVIKTPCNKM